VTASALAAADVGIASGTGTDVVIESAGVTLLEGDLQGIVRAKHRAWAMASMKGLIGQAGISAVERLGGVFAIAVVVNNFSDAVVKTPSPASRPRTHNCRNDTLKT